MIAGGRLSQQIQHCQYHTLVWVHQNADSLAINEN